MLRTLRRIHEDEEGLETLQVVLIIAVAAIILAVIKVFWPHIRHWAKNMINAITGWGDPDAAPPGAGGTDVIPGQ